MFNSVVFTPHTLDKTDKPCYPIVFKGTKMRCYCCNEALTDYESTLRDIDNIFIDTCLKCIKDIHYMNPTMLIKSNKGVFIDINAATLINDSVPDMSSNIEDTDD